MIKAVIFDLDDTLYDYSGLNEKAIEKLCMFTCECLGISRGIFFDAFERARKDVKDALGETGASHNRMLYCQKTLENLGGKPVTLALEMYEVYWNYILTHMILRAGVDELLKYCIEKGLKIGICTDLTAYIQHRKLRKLGLDCWVDALVTSEEAGAEKPCSVIYKLILKKLGVRPEEALFIGDNLKKDVEGPLAMGMKAVLFDTEKTDYSSFTAGMIEDIRRIIDAG